MRFLRRSFEYILILVAIGIAPIIANADELTAKILAAPTGDQLIAIDSDNHIVRVRLAGITAPEPKDAMFQKSAQHLAEVVLNKIVTVQYLKGDSSGQLVGKVLVANEDAGLEQINNGFAWYNTIYRFEQSSSDQSSYSEAEKTAKLNGLGIWAYSRDQPWIAHIKSNYEMLDELAVKMNYHLKHINNCLLVSDLPLENLITAEELGCTGLDPLNTKDVRRPETFYLYNPDRILGLLKALRQVDALYCQHCQHSSRQVVMVILDRPMLNAASYVNSHQVYVEFTTGLLRFSQHAGWAILDDYLKRDFDKPGDTELTLWQEELKTMGGKQCHVHVPLPGASSDSDDDRLIASKMSFTLNEFILAHELAHVYSDGLACGAAETSDLSIEEHCDAIAFDKMGSQASLPFGNTSPEGFFTFLTMIASYEQLTAPAYLKHEHLTSNKTWAQIFPARDWKARGQALLKHWDDVCGPGPNVPVCNGDWQTKVSEMRAELEKMSLEPCHPLTE